MGENVQINKMVDKNKNLGETFVNIFTSSWVIKIINLNISLFNYTSKENICVSFEFSNSIFHFFKLCLYNLV